MMSRNDPACFVIFFMFQHQEVLLLGPRTECWRSGHHLPHGEIHRNKDIDIKTRNKKQGYGY